MHADASPAIFVEPTSKGSDSKGDIITSTTQYQAPVNQELPSEISGRPHVAHMLTGIMQQLQLVTEAIQPNTCNWGGHTAKSI